jgi:hypothetical protein|tara:strand:+ start:238 stop:528 length:291 start_codon:yes stop_codon:yes gene_type:complete
MSYFITVLLFFPFLAGSSIPSEGWLQWNFSFQNRATCVEFLEEEQENILAQVNRSFRAYPYEVREIQCMTDKEAADLNGKLGHTRWKTPKKKKPMM